MPEIPTSFFLKELPDSPVYLPSGQRVVWDRIDSEVGVLATQDAGLIFQLSNLAEQRRGGVVKIDQGRYEELVKKKSGSDNLPQPVKLSVPQAPFRVAQSPVPVAQPAVAAPRSDAVAAVKAEQQPQLIPDVPPQKAVRRGKIKQ